MRLNRCRYMLRRLSCERVGSDLEMHHEWPGPLAAFFQPRRAIATRHPEAAALPARIRVIDTAIEALAVEAQRIGNAHRDELAVDECVHAVE